MSDPILSVVIPAYQAEAHIGETLDSLAAQTLPGIEAVVVDDGSTDGTADLVEARARTFPITLIRQQNAGVSAARNRGISAARGRLVALLDADDLWHPDKARRQIARMDADPRIALSFTGYRIVDSAGHDLLERGTPPDGPLPLAQLIRRNVIQPSAVILRADALRAAGPFNETLRYAEDFDLWCRVAALPGAVLYGLSEALCDYRRHDHQTSRDWRKMHDGWRIVTDRFAAAQPDVWREAESAAWAHQMEYYASIAWHAGDVASTRSLMARALRYDARAVLGHGDGRIMTGILVCSYLPHSVQLVIAKAFAATRRARRARKDRRPTT